MIATADAQFMGRQVGVVGSLLSLKVHWRAMTQAPILAHEVSSYLSTGFSFPGRGTTAPPRSSFTRELLARKSFID